jgi:AraC-like DNA-binding protein
MTLVTFTDYDAFAETVRDASVTLRLTAMHVSQWTLQYVTVGSLGLQRGFEGGGTVAEGVTRGDGWTFFAQSSPLLTNGQVLDTDSVFAVPPRSEFCLACKPSHAWISIFIPTCLLFPSPPDLEFASAANARVLTPRPHVTRRFLSLAHRVLASTESRPQLLEHRDAMDSCRRELVAAARELFISCERSSSRHYARWRRLTQSTLEMAMSDPTRVLSVPELAQRAGTPERTLRAAFRGSFGISPMEYLRIQRLHEARRLLRAHADHRMTVTQVAFGLGFWDLGRFAGAYRSLFGERPSETLRKPMREATGRRRG